MAGNPANELVSAIQSVHIIDKPDIEHDLNPSTAASKKVPARIISSSSSTEEKSTTKHSREHRAYSLTSSPSTSSTSTIPSEIIHPHPRRRTLPPFPDFRFEQSYLKSIKAANSNWQVAYITIRDQFIWPLISGIAYNLLMFGWRHWNRESKLQGASLGARLRKWWWGVNNWKVPQNSSRQERRLKMAREAEEFFQAKVSSAQGE